MLTPLDLNWLIVSLNIAIFKELMKYYFAVDSDGFNSVKSIALVNEYGDSYLGSFSDLEESQLNLANTNSTQVKVGGLTDLKLSVLDFLQAKECTLCGHEEDYTQLSQLFGENPPSKLSKFEAEELSEGGFSLEKALSTLYKDVPTSLIQLSDGIARIPVAKKGEFHHKVYGKVPFTSKDYEDIKRNFENDVLGFNPYATQGHLRQEFETESEYLDQILSTDAQLKKGDLLSIEEEEDILWATYKVKDSTYELLKNGELEYSSGEFIRNFIDKDTGKNLGTVLARTALTNAPFIPFKDKKIQTLSQSADNSSHSVENFVFKLSTESIQTDLAEEVNSINEEEIKTPQELDKANTELPTEPINDNDKNPNMSTENLPNEEIKIDKPSDVTGFDLTELVNQTALKVKQEYDEILTQSKLAIAALTSQNEVLTSNFAELTSKFATQDQTVQAFSNSISYQEKQARNNELIRQGIAPAQVEKFSLILDTLETAGASKNVIQLSTSVVENGQQVLKQVDKGISEAIKELLVDATYSTPTVVNQLSQGVTPSLYMNAHESEMNALINNLKAQNAQNAKKTLAA